MSHAESVEIVHHMAQIGAELRLHYLPAGHGHRVVVWLHGYPRTSHEWRRMIPGFVRVLVIMSGG
jgi:pimeloyl-ACP methyl ester carboxylesterase